MWGKIVFRKLELTASPTNLANQVILDHALDQSHSVQTRGPEGAHQKTLGCHGDRQGQIADFSIRFVMIKWLYVDENQNPFQMGVHYQLNLEPTWPNSLIGCKVPTDLMKIIVKNYNMTEYFGAKWHQFFHGSGLN